MSAEAAGAAEAAEAAVPAGAAPLTHRRVLGVALPIMLSNATVPILGLVDTGVVGQIGEAAPIGAVGVGAIVISFLYWTFGFLRMGTSGLVAQARGAGDAAETGALLMRGLMIAAAAGSVFLLLQAPLFGLGLWIMSASAEVSDLAWTYLTIRVWAAPFAIGLYALTGWLIAMERTRGVLILQLWINGLNILLDLIFVLGLGWGVAGVAAATVIAEVSGGCLGLWMCREAFGGAQWRNWSRILDPARVKRMMQVNADILLRSLLLEVSFAFFVAQSARGGDVALAANQILFQFVHVIAHTLDGFAFAAETLVGQAFGAGRSKGVRRAAILSSSWGLVCVTALALFFSTGGPALVDWMTTEPDVRLRAREFLVWCALAPAISLPAFMFDGVFIGATRTRDMRNGMLISAGVYLVAWAALTPLLGQHGLWAALMVLFGARGVTLARRYPALERAAEGR